MPIGGAQAVAIHKLPGGARIIDVMGHDEAEIGWSGYLDGQEASSIARTLDKLRVSGQAVTLAWDVFSYQVLVTQFACDTKHAPMTYKVTCTVIADNSAVTGTTAVSMALQVVSDLRDGNPIAVLGAVSQGIVGDSVTTAATTAGATDATTVGSAAYNAAVSDVNTAAASIQSAASAADATLAPYGTSLAALSQAAPAGLDALGFSSTVTSAVASCGDIANLSAASGYVTRAAQNLRRASA
jgi:hypothetical protein